MKNRRILLITAILLCSIFSAMGASVAAADQNWISQPLASLTASLNDTIENGFKYVDETLSFTKTTELKDDDLQQAPQTTRPDIHWMRGGHTSSNIGISRSADRQTFATVGGDTTVKIWRSSDDALVRTIQPFGVNGAIYRPALSPDGTLVAVSGFEISPNYLVKIFRVSDGALVQTITGFNDFLNLAISPDNQYLLTGGSNSTVGKLYRISDGGFIRSYSYNGNNYGSGGVAFSPNGQNVVLAAPYTNTLPALFETTTGNFIRSMSVFAGGFEFSPDGQYLTGSTGGGTYVFRVADGSTIGLQSGAPGGYASFSPNGQYLAVGYDMVNVKVWQVSGASTWSLLQQFQAEPMNTAGNYAAVSFNAANQLITTYASIKVWNPSNGAFLRNISHFAGSIRALAYTSDGQKVAVSNSGNLTNSLRLLNPTSGLPIVDFPQSYGLGIYQLAITPDGQRIVTVDGFDNRHFVKVWNALDGSLIRNTEMTYGGFLTVAVSDNQNYILTGYAGVGGFPTTQFKISDGSVVRTFSSNGCIERVLDISSDGSLFALNKYQCSNSLNNGLFFYRISDGAVLRQIADPFAQGSNGGIQNGTFSPNGQNFAISAKYASPTGPYPVYLFRISDGARIREFVGHQSSSDGIAFTPDGLNLATTSWDNTVRFWRVSDGALLNTFDEETLFTNTDSLSSNIKFSPDGSRFAYARRDATVVMARNPYVTYSISGQITNNGNPLSGISVALSGASSATVVTDSNGNYSFSGLTAGGNFTLTPANTGLYSFTPQTVNNLQTNQTVNFTGTLRTYTISGKVFASNGTTALQGVTVNLTGPTSASSVTDAAGNYSLTFNAGGNYTVQPANTAVYSFGQLNLQGATSNQTSNFVGTLNNYSISGQITRNGAPLAGVTVALSGNSTASTTTDGQGNYTFASVSASGNYTVTPSLANHSFTPPNSSISNLTANQTANFTATLNCTYSLSPTSVNVAATAGSGSFNVTTQTGCTWSAQSSSSFLTTSSSGSSSGTVNYSYTANSGTARNATITVGGQTFTLNQSVAILRRAPFDFDGDGKTDIGIFRPSAGEWWINYSNSGQTFAVQFGMGTDRIVPGDYTGDGKTDIAFYRPSNNLWYILRSEDNSFFAYPFGSSGDIAVPADYDGDGKTDTAVFRESNLTWYIQKSSGGFDFIGFGVAGDKPVVADYDGDGKADVAITRFNNGNLEWWIRRSSDGQIASRVFGENGDKAVQGDYTGDGKADIAIFRPSTGFWYIVRSEDASFFGFPFGSNGDQPTPGDYDGDGKIDPAVFRDSNKVWYQQRSTQGFAAITFGSNGDQPIPTAYVP